MNNELFKNKKILIFLPHEDDEINIVGGLLDSLKKEKANIKVVYYTNGDFAVKPIYRLKEAIQSLKCYNIPRENVIFMGYSDQAPGSKDHLYLHEKDEFYSNKQINKTSAPKPFIDYHSYKYNKPALFNKENFINDLVDIILDEMPDIIIGIDYDSHPDHRALCLALDNALGKVIKQYDYHPLFLKAFAYPTSYLGVEDFNNINMLSTKFNHEEGTYEPYQNPYFNFENRLRFEVGKNSRNKFLLFNTYFKTTLKHKSQYILNKVYSIINNDQIFFVRNTDNLCLNAKISATSGNVLPLNDFMIFDSSDILDIHSNDFDKGYFCFDDKDKDRIITINLDKKSTIKRINIFKRVNSNKINTLKINGKSYQILDNSNIITIDLDLKNISKISLQFNSNVEITEIELLKELKTFNYFKLCINDDFVYKYYTDKDFQVDYYTNISKDNIVLKKKINNSFETLESNVIKFNNKDFEIWAFDKKGNVLDRVKIRVLNSLRLFRLRILFLINNYILFLGRVYQKLAKEFRKFINKF